MTQKRKPFPQFNPFRDFVIDELRRRKSTDIPVPTVAPFVRFTSCMEDPVLDYAFFSLGLHGFDGSDGSGTSNIFDLTYGTRKEVVGYAYSRSKDLNTGLHNKRLIFADDISPNADSFKQFVSPSFTVQDAENLVQQKKNEQLSKIPQAAHPIPGITNVSIIRRGLGQPLIATINWQCYNQGQLEFLRNHFLVTGNYVVLEIGNQFSNKQIKTVLPFRNNHAVTWNNLLQSVGAVGEPNQLLSQRGREFVIESFNRANDGNYDFIVGAISNYEINLEPETGIYKCTTKIVSQGENIWGITIAKTFVDQVTAENHGITTIKDYFEEGRYQSFIESCLASKVPGIIKTNSGVWSNAQDATKPGEQGRVDQNPSDFAFVTWKFLTEDLLNDILSTIKAPAVKEEIKHFAQLKTVLPDDYVGYHPLLKSAEPESMLLINKTISNIASAQEYNAYGIFEPKPNVEGNRAGKLNEGVWINTGMIREAFMVSYDLRQAFSFILSRMNRSVGGYWDLRLFWDDERATYRVIDYKYGTQHRNEKFYKFNVGGAGECLSIEFDSAFPPELVTQMNLVAMFQTMNSADKARYLENYPLLGSTSAHMFILNWTHLRDGLRDKINQWRDKSYPSPQMTAAPVLEKLGLTTQLRVTQPNSTGLVPSTQGSENRSAGDKVGTTMPSQTSPDNTSISSKRNSVKPEPNTIIGDIQSKKLSTHVMPAQGPVTSKISPARINPVDGVVRPHNGIDIAATQGSPVVAAMDGLVITAARSDTLGNYVVIDHGNGIITRYGHMERLLVNKRKVTRGEQIGTVGSTGRSSGPHLHYELLVNGKPIDPTNLTSTNVQQAPSQGPGDSGLVSTTPPAGAIKPPSQDEQARLKRSQELKELARNIRRAEVTAKFGTGIADLISDHLGDMINNITKDGYVNGIIPNQFVSPFPTTTSITVEIQGIAGISVGDGFFVDKIPFMFEKHGVFQVTEIKDIVTERGWRTHVSGYFKMLWYDGQGNSEVIT